MAKWDSIVGDCRQELVFIGQDLEIPALQRALDTCLLSAEEIAAGPAVWQAAVFDSRALSTSTHALQTDRL